MRTLTVARLQPKDFCAFLGLPRDVQIPVEKAGFHYLLNGLILPQRIHSFISSEV